MNKVLKVCVQFRNDYCQIKKCGHNKPHYSSFKCGNKPYKYCQNCSCVDIRNFPSMLENFDIKNNFFNKKEIIKGENMKLKSKKGKKETSTKNPVYSGKVQINTGTKEEPEYQQIGNIAVWDFEGEVENSPLFKGKITITEDTEFSEKDTINVSLWKFKPKEEEE